MADPTHDDGRHQRPHPASLGGPFLELDLARALAQLEAEPDGPHRQNALTLAKLDDLRIVLITLRAAARIPDHQARGGVSIHVVRGHVAVHAEGRTFNLRSGGLLALAHGVLHSVDAVEDSALLLTIAWPVPAAARE